MHRIYQKAHRSIAVGFAAFAVVALAYSPAALAATSSTTVTGTIGSTITVNSGASVALNVSPASGAAVSTASNTVTVVTNNSTGYDLTLSTTGTERNLVKGSDTIAAHSGTWASPSTLATNTWGYRIDSAGTFGSGPTSVLNSAASSSQTWAGVPASTSAQNIKTSSTNTSGGGDVVTVWYAMSADATKPSGNYTNSVVYTAVTKP